MPHYLQYLFNGIYYLSFILRLEKNKVSKWEPEQNMHANAHVSIEIQICPFSHLRPGGVPECSRVPTSIQLLS